ncbi:similar to Saccharomyces cerevisiae YER158C Protein of unknown function, has similarity to Afr1p [Maudiozyma barnettii]|uniref:Uncharacterized protein n=1 Tax=Maudiozyma barnettii TaxID=61262 RepID=A0A8H2VHF4_9SACH|nr:uncharacterized protein KABA2_07S03190 [Kazachstania barnettii]CAB4255731.1 similar to Saccharomyces cerevisiae YER158C Protein of unknown function, has similarity to Afr1p [Kazachstania barnettii]CAD1784292.1 similar to Saccharomyces cerevisiae YER158C Protein of unknown function, has similarity to Afr1p [Kazachstania barnettii]
MQDGNSPYIGGSSFGQNHIARSNSTSDLFNLTADIQHKNTHPMKKIYHTQSMNGSNFNHHHHNNNTIVDKDFCISTNHATKKKLTPYQVQRQKMQKSFMFPNGENFTPKRSKHYSMNYNDENSNFITHRNSSSTSINSAPTFNYPRSNSLTITTNKNQTIMKQKKLSTWSLNLQDTPIAPLSSSSSPNVMKDIMEIKAQSPVNSKKSSDSDNSMKEDNQSNNTLPTTNSDIEVLQENIVKPIVLSDKISSPSIDLTTNVSLSLAKTNSNVTLSKPSEKTEPLKLRKSSKRPKTSSSESLPVVKDAEIRKKKTSSNGLKFGSFFKKLFGGNSSSNEKHKKRKLNKSTKMETKSNPPKIETDLEKSSPIIEDITLSLDIENEIDDNLMDTDLIFDSILLKMNNGKTTKPTTKSKKVEKLTVLAPRLENTSFENSCEDPNFVDHSLVNDFAKLGNFINLSISDDINQPPPRSSKRPTLESKKTASEFYNAQPNIIKRLQNEFGIVLIGETPSKQISSKTERSILKRSCQKSTVEKNNIGVRFTNEVYLTNTYSLSEYERKDKGFKKRMTLLMQRDRTFFDSVKKELNYYKSHEMAVHQDMKQFTQFFD